MQKVLQPSTTAFYYGCFDVYCLHKFSKYIPYKLSIEKRRSTVDAWGVDLQKDMNFVPFHLIYL